MRSTITHSPAHSNALIGESSPYLLQHAHNPVNWQPWGVAAFKQARREDKLIFLSIGYSTCYWCHVMERECFENEAIAALMNRDFVCIKVDREERPDVDDIYMTATQLLSGSGGWPMSVFIEPASLQPFLAGTYFPPEDNFGRPGFPAVLRQVADYWKHKRDAVIRQAASVADAVRLQLHVEHAPVAIGSAHVEKAISQLMASHDARDGGFGGGRGGGGGGPKFPTPVNLDFLLAAAWDRNAVRQAVLLTLDRMATGGMYDQIGGGFHRYSTDEKWLVPHFEKMLYDNGQLASTYARAFELTQDQFYAQVLRETLDYVLREMTDAGGGFFSAQDAEVKSLEGDNYLWLAAEIRTCLTDAGLAEHVDFALEIYGLHRGTNFRDPHHAEQPPRNVIHLIDRPDRLARQMNLTIEQFNARRARINMTLLAARNARPQPRLDDKILAGWNGLMIAGMADGGRVLNDRTYIDAAGRGANYVLNTMRSPEGVLLRSARNGKAKIAAFLEDYALEIRGLLALHQATGNAQWLAEATSIASLSKDAFWDSGDAMGGYFDTQAGQSDLFVRVKATHDGAIPSGNSVMLNNLIDLHEATGENVYLEDAAMLVRGLSSAMEKHPTAAPLLMRGVYRLATEYPRALAAPAGARAGRSEHASPIAIALSVGEVEITTGAPAAFSIVIDIQRRYHLTAPAPSNMDLVPLGIELTDGEGLRLIADYPPGEPIRGGQSDGGGGTATVYRGRVTIPIQIEQVAAVTGRPAVMLTYQACTDAECLLPQTVMLDLRIVSAR